jgi:hypothetical protein
MKLSLDLIAESLSLYNGQMIFSGEKMPEFHSVQILSAPCDMLEDGVLYVCEPRVLPRLKKALFHDHGFVFKATPQQIQCRHLEAGIILDGEVSLNQITNHLIKLFESFNSFEYRVREASLGHGGLEAFFALADREFPHGLLVASDSAYNIICASRKSSGDQYIDHCLARGYYNSDDLNKMATRGYYEDERKYLKPIYYTASQTVCGYPWLVRSYRSNGAAFGFVGCYYLEGELTLADMALFTCLTDGIETYYKLNGLLESSLTSAQQLMDDLISPKHLDGDYFRDRCSRLPVPYQGPFRIGLIQSEIDTKIKSSQIMNQIRACCPVSNYGVFLYGTYVIVLFRDWNSADVKEMATFDDDWNSLSTTLQMNKAHMGVSLEFQDCSKFHVGYRQALAAVNCGRSKFPGKATYMYSKFYLDDMLIHYSEKIPIEDVYVHYLDRLLDDGNNVCSNIKLLYYYLCSERNLSLTASTVHMHRNSVIYRIQKIKDILSLDLDDPDVRLRLMISIKIMGMINRIPQWDKDEEDNVAFID